MSRGAAIRAAMILAASAAVGILIGTGILWAVLELDDGAHDIFGPERPATIQRVR